MDNRPVGVFDSGLGGLTVVKALGQLMPNENILYLGDTGRVPYGSRSKETITKYAAQCAAFLYEKDIKAMVVACNTVCSVAYGEINEKYDLPVYEVVSAPSSAAVQSTKNGKIGVIGTTATIKSNVYQSAIHKLNKDITVFSIPCPLFVPLVEEGWIKTGDEAATQVAKRYLAGLIESDIDTLILGCTHYPLLAGVIKAVMGNKVTLIDSAIRTAQYIKEDLEIKDMLTGDTDKEAKTQYFVTDSIESFSTQASKFLESDINNMVTKIELE